jgi:hypothetical protein
MITLGDLKTRANFQLTLALDMAKGAYHNQYRSQTYPRLEVVKVGGPAKLDRKYDTIYYVDGIECEDLEAVIAMLNAEPHPMRTGLMQHQRDMDSDG